MVSLNLPVPDITPDWGVASPGSDWASLIVAAFNTLNGAKIELGGDLTGTVGAPTVGKVAGATVSGTPGTPSSSNFFRGDGTWQSIADVASALLGQVNGVPVQGWQPAQNWPGECWRTSNFLAGYNTTSLTPTITGNSTAQTLRTLVAIGSDISNDDQAFRVAFQINNAPSVGTYDISIGVVGTSGSLLSGTAYQSVFSNSIGSSWVPFEIEFDLTTLKGSMGGTAYIDVKLSVQNNVTAGNTLSITNVTIRETSGPSRAMWYGYSTGGAGPNLCTQLYDPVARAWRMARTSLVADTMSSITGYSSPQVFVSGTGMPDSDMLAANVSSNQNGQVATLPNGTTSRELRTVNDDQIFNVLKADGVTYELRGNVHGGETLRSDPNNGWFADIHGDGTLTSVALTTNAPLKYCRRFKQVSNTVITRSAPESDNVINTDHTMTFFPDGMMRMDRTSTFLANVRIKDHFEWMSSHNTALGKLGRIGNGLLVQDQIDTFPKVAAPVIGTATTATTGGTLAAATYGYVVTALGRNGESDASLPASVTTTGTTSTTTVNWSASSGALGYNIYGRQNVMGARVLLATVAAGTTSWTDTGAAIESGVRPPLVNQARDYAAASAVQAAAFSGTASWTVWYDPIINMCFGNIYDRDSIAARPNVAAVKVRLERGSGICKSYVNVIYADDGLGDNSRLITGGTVWTATHFCFSYVPADPVNYHLEIAARAASLAKLKTIYPSL